MTTPVETITYKGYTIEIHYDDDACNPLKDFDAPTLVLHEKAEGHFGWTTDDDWGSRLNGALDEIAERGFTRNLHGERGALAVIQRWLRVYHGIEHLVPVGAGEHSGTWTYLGSGAHWCDPGGWDSGWVGWFFATPKQLEEWGRSPNWTEQDLIDSFEEFRAWVSNEVFGYIIKDADDHEIDDGSCWGYYGYDSYKEGRNGEPDGYMLDQCKSIIDHEIADRLEKANNLFKALVAEGRNALVGV